MARTVPSGTQLRREIPIFEGVNCLVEHNVSKKQELEHCENSRSTMIGSTEKRSGTSELGYLASTTANYGLFYFPNSVNDGLHRISSVGGYGAVYYYSSGNWSAVNTVDTTEMFELGDSTTRYDITNPAGTNFVYTWDDTGTDPRISHKIRVGDTLAIQAQNFSAGNKGTFTVTAVAEKTFTIVNAGGVVESDKTIGTGYIRVTPSQFSTTVAENCCFLVNGSHDNFYIEATGNTTKNTSDANGHLYGAPLARKIKYYKDKLYIADFNVGSVRFKNSVMMSSPPLGIVSLVDGDHDAGVTTIVVTDTKYIRATDSLDVYRGGTSITSLTVSAKTETTITVTATSVPLLSADEIWVSGTYTGSTRLFRWPDNPASGTTVKQYDTFRIDNSTNGSIKMMETVADSLLFATENEMAVWNGNNLSNLDLSIGCCSDRGYVKAMGTLWFIHYSGIYMTSGAVPKLMSAKVEKYIQGATKAGIQAAVMGRKGLSILCYLGTVNLYNDDGTARKTMSDVVLEYNMRQENWFVHTGIPLTHLVSYFDTDNTDTLVGLSSSSGFPALKIFDGVADYASHSAVTEIPWRIDTSNITLAGTFETPCYPVGILLDTEVGTGIKCFVSLDNGSWRELTSEAVQGCTLFKVHNDRDDESGPPRCRKLRISFREFSKKKVKITRAAIIYNTSMEVDNHDPNNN